MDPVARVDFAQVEARAAARLAQVREQLHRGIAQRDAVALVRELGGEAEVARRTGDMMFRHPLMPRPTRLNCRRKDTPRFAVVWLRELVGRLLGE